ncbi:MAG: hypothetical protein GY862_19130 [Gammaproteobacteria bacterium]|nr:hypothetical protein [Gammaproteobacteria bacterium]
MNTTDTDEKINYILEVEKPVSFWLKPLKIDLKKIFFGVAQIGIGSSQGSSRMLLGGANDTVSAIEFKEQPAILAWLLIFNALVDAMSNLAEKNRHLWKKPDEHDKEAFQTQLKDASEHLAQRMEKLALRIDRDFLEHPNRLLLVERFQPLFRDWLLGFGIEVPQANTISKRLPLRFGFSLHNLWMKEPEAYESLRKELEKTSPFAGYVRRRQAWRRYGGWLKAQADEPVFAEAFALEQVYIELRAWYLHKEKHDGKEQEQRCVTDLTDTLLDWIEKADSEDCFRVIRGGPGSGKSSFAKIFAARVCEQYPDLPILFVPLQRLRLEEGLAASLKSFMEDPPYLLQDLSNPLRADSEEKDLLVIFDGLDELSKAGESSARLVKIFVEEVREAVRIEGRDKNWRVLFCGRDLAVQGVEYHFRKEGAILHLLPYYLEPDERKKYIDPRNLLTQDQRELWWRKYWQAVKEKDNGMPQELRGENLPETSRHRLNDITAQPLLNYLAALALCKENLQIDRNTSLNIIYSKLLEGVYDRQYESVHQNLKKLEPENFYRLLEEIAVTAWHGGDARSTTAKEIKIRCGNDLESYLKDFKDSAEGVTSLLTSFYFRKLDDKHSEERFEFTHKSFGEYLIARAIVNKLEYIREELERRKKNPRHRYDTQEALADWAALCGPNAVDEDLMAFILDEIAIPEYATKVSAWQECLTGLLQHAIEFGMPMEKLDPRPPYQAEMQQARNAEEALLVVMHGCLRKLNGTKISCRPRLVSEQWDNYLFRNWLLRLQGQRSADEAVVFAKNLAWLDLRQVNLVVGVNLEWANLEGANLVEANLAGAILVRAILIKAYLEEANLVGANLAGAFLMGANLVRANLAGANLAGAILDGANLAGANLAGANLARADFNEADLAGATLLGTCLEEADLAGADLTGANLMGADLSEALHLNQSLNLKRAENLEQAILPEGFGLPLEA